MKFIMYAGNLVCSGIACGTLLINGDTGPGVRSVLWKVDDEY